MSAGLVCHGATMPPMDVIRIKPTVPYAQFEQQPDALVKTCMGPGFACAYPSPTKAQPDRWAIVLDATLTSNGKRCAMVYELAHLPPNFWYDTSFEYPETARYMQQLKAAYDKAH